jgi:hypothetical protein
MERGPLSLVSTIEELLERKSSGSGLKAENPSVGIRRTDRATPLYPQKLALISPASGSRSIGIIPSRTKIMELFYHSVCLCVEFISGRVCVSSCDCGRYTHC